MQPVDRILSALSHEEPDRIPIYDLVSSHAFLDHWAGEPVTLENAQRTIPVALSRSLDMTRVFLPAETGKYTDAQGFTHERTDWFNEWQTGVPFTDLAGLARFVAGEIERLEAWQPGYMAESLRETASWSKAFAPAVIPASWAGEALQDAYIRVGLDWFIWLDAEQPQLSERWLRAIHTAHLRRLQAETAEPPVSPIAWIFADIAYKQRMMFSPRYLHSHGFFTRIAELTSFYHGRGLKVIFHSDGDIRAIIAELVRTGVDAIAPIDTAAGMSLAELKPQYGNDLTFVGGIDIESLLRLGTGETIRAAVGAAIRAAGQGGGLILGSSSEELFDNLPLENILAFHEAVHDFSRTSG